MNKETQSIIKRLEITLSGEPWFGRSVYAILEEVDAKKATIKPNSTEHSLIELLYHMIIWADFALKRMEKDKKKDLAATEKLDWRINNPKVDTWKKGLAELKAIHKKIIDLLNSKDDDFLLEIVGYRKYNFRFLLNGMIEHNIYHLDQVAT